jgi:hypothetical protein
MVLPFALPLEAAGQTAFLGLFRLVLPESLLRIRLGLAPVLLFLADTVRLFRTTFSLTWLSIPVWSKT